MESLITSSRNKMENRKQNNTVWIGPKSNRKQNNTVGIGPKSNRKQNNTVVIGPKSTRQIVRKGKPDTSNTPFILFGFVQKI